MIFWLNYGFILVLTDFSFKIGPFFPKREISFSWKVVSNPNVRNFLESFTRVTFNFFLVSFFLNIYSYFFNRLFVSGEVDVECITAEKSITR
jgi:hypothetical protein